MEIFEGGVTSAKGFKASGVFAGLKKARKDMAMIVSECEAVAAGTYTTNKVKAAPVLWDMKLTGQGKARAVVVNSGNANACTGEQGLKDAEEMASYAAGLLSTEKELVLVASTGVIGVNLDMAKIKKGEELLVQSLSDDWKEEWVIKQFRDIASSYSTKEMDDARRAFMAQCTHIDYSIRLIIGSLREHNLLDDTIIVFMSDHGDMLFDHGMVAKRLFYESSACVPLIFSGRPMLEYRGKGYEKKLCQICDVMPTLLDLCGIEIPDRMDGIPIFSDQKRDYVFGEIGEDAKATRMIRDEKYKLVYYPAGNVSQLFDMQRDRREEHDLAPDPAYADVLHRLQKLLIGNLHGGDTSWVRNGQLEGIPVTSGKNIPNFGLLNQRGSHWPPVETGYSH